MTNKKTLHFKDALTPEADRTYRVTLSSGNIDREGDTIDPRGWTSTDSVPVQIDHNHSVLATVGRVAGIHVEGNALVGVMELAPAGIADVIDEVARRLNARVARDVSVGFRPLEWEMGDEGIAFIKQELLELSIVSTPAQPDAVIDARGQQALNKWLGPLATVPIKRGAPTHLSAVRRCAEMLAARQKAGARHSQADRALIQSAHDSCVQLGATCTSEAADDEKHIDLKSIPGDDIGALDISQREVDDAIASAIAEQLMLHTGQVR